MSTFLSSGAPTGEAQANPPAGKLFDRAYEKYFDFVCRVLYTHGVAFRDLHDEAQETFLSFSKTLVPGSGRPDERRGRFLYTIAVNRARNYRTNARLRYEVLGGDPCVDGPEVAGHTVAPETLISLKETLARVDPSLMPILQLLLEGFTFQEIGTALHIPIGTVASRMRRVQLRAKRARRREVA